MLFITTVASLLAVAGSADVEEETFFQAIDTQEEVALNDEEVREIVFDDDDEDSEDEE